MSEVSASNATAPPCKPRVAVHKFSSCDGCQLALLNAGEALLALAERVDLVHFAEAGPMDPEAEVDIAFVEGSVSTPEDRSRIVRVRSNSRFLVTLGACATAGGIQALRNFADGDGWLGAVYASPEFVSSLAQVSPIREHVHVDLELWGCPVSGRQVVSAVGSLLAGAPPAVPDERLCLECKRQQAVCVMVTRGAPCMGPVTRTGCGALCPRFERDCYGCYGPAEHSNTQALGRRFAGLGLVDEAVVRRFHFINSQAPAFLEAGQRARGHADD
ncbi:sulfhydrogenase subunit delta [Acidihalobacter aeolianus]|uniref:Sulfhydrogenase subunit delta n=1 Tax=Acidihalobacter aeolianus TaxID=2792603 RepID=A0A1D8K6I4_9GAMM|nr:sulfhydrogenase subunit delta [Acidihalobacter aeolianus]AOV16568.1 sulfhydrogenase subunit delta [Acidihalobacter aeolianus]